MRVIKILATGCCITLLLFGAGYVAAERGLLELSYALYWQGWVLGMLVACENCKPSLIHMIAFYAGIPVGIAVYSALVWAVLGVGRVRARSTSPP